MRIARQSPEDPIRAELFGIERLEQHAESLAAAQRVGGAQEIGACLDLDESQDAAAPDHDVDLAELGLVAPRQHRIARQA